MPTKIIATIGPKSESKEKLLALLKAGVDMVRVNFSHASHSQYLRIQKIIKDFNAESERQIKIMLDLQGPRIRVGRMPEGGIFMADGESYRFAFSNKPYVKAGDVIPIDSHDLYQDIKKGEVLFLCNGAIELQVKAIKNKIITAEVINGGVLSSRKAINVPDTHIRKGGMTAKDLKDAAFGLKAGVDYIALSFVQTANDVLRLRRLLGKKNGIKIISKIERGLALKHIDKIITSSDAIMVARGDLGIEVPIEDLPIIQKNLVRHAHWHDRPAIIATQVMTSMIKNAHPTRAEISDIANAVLDGADMIMLSDETTIGDYPVEAVKILKKVIERTEKYIYKGNVDN
ncbi:MAG TPA: pyruvate kinase [bacterium]|nr:pyruvate kinase [bacterium]